MAMSKAERIRRYLEKYPGADNAEIVQKLSLYDITAKDVYQTRRRAREERRVPAEEHGDQFKLTVTLPEGGILLRVQNGSGIIGTLLIDSGGLAYKGANAKKAPRRKVSYEVLKLIGQLELD